MAQWIIPSNIRLEGSSFCQLRCPSCPTTTKAIDPVVGKGFLKAENFRKLLEENPSLKLIELSNYGEIFLNPEILEIMACAHEHGVTLTGNNGVNLNNVRDEVLEGVVKYGFHSMVCSIDGATQETYAKYRVRGSLETVLGNIEKINGFKRQYGSELPRLEWQFIIFGHNEHEIEAAQRLAESLGMTFRAKLSWDDGFSSVKDKEAVARLSGVGVASRAEFKEKHGYNYMQGICQQLWHLPQINWDGKVLGCCRNFWGDFGANAFTDGLEKAVNSEKMLYAREMLLGEKPARDDIPCTTCEIYLGMKADNRFFSSGQRPLQQLRRRQAAESED
ncbi:radical SAM protein [Pelagibius sp. CAU 1746]|uniref:radical SAM/SPASM domain-containing protein n=1 Tax=Pelagibius sp. CAU 1746 TaxID=3140370 RepID=UPI00325A6713